MKAYFLSLLLLMTGVAAHAQPTQAWQQTHGGRLGSEVMYDFIRTGPNRLLTLGYTQYRQITGIGDRPTLMFFNNSGDSLTTRMPALPPQFELRSYKSAAVLPGGDLLLLHNRYDAALGITLLSLVRTDSLGVQRWQRPLPLPGYGFAYGFASRALLALPDGGALLTVADTYGPVPPGRLPTPIATVLRVDSAGSILWQRRYGQPSGNLEVIRALPDGSYALCGYQESSPSPTQRLTANGWLLQIKLNGDTIRSRYFGQAVSDEFLRDVVPTPDGGLQLCGSYTPQANVGQPNQGWLLRLDSLGQQQWQHYIPNGTAGRRLTLWRNWVLQDGKVLVTGIRQQPVDSPLNLNGYVAAWQPGPAGSTPALSWELPFGPQTYDGVHYSMLDTNGDLTLMVNRYVGGVGATIFGNDVMLTRFTGAGVPYEPALCQVPPVARAAYAIPTPDSLVCQQASEAGPRYAQLVAWHWNFGDGTSSRRPAARHAYAPGVARPGLAVSLTVTNNLGCQHTEVRYPFGVLATRSPLTDALALYPNPTTGEARLELAGLPAGPVRGEVLNALGQVVQALRGQGGAGAPALQLDLRPWPAGVYIIRLHTATGVAVRRLVKQ